MKNNRLKGLLVAAALLCAQAFSAGTGANSWESGRTHLNVDDLSLSTRWNRNFSRLMTAAKPDDAADVTIYGHAFWQQNPKSRSGEKLAKGLMFGENGTVLDLKNASATDVNHDKGQWSVSNLFVRATGNYETAFDAVMTVTDVQHRRIGGGVGLAYDASRFYEGLCMGLDVNFVYVRNKVDYTITGANAPELEAYVSGLTPSTAALKGGAPVAVTNYLSSVPVMKMDKKNHSDQAVNDVSLHLGLKVVENDTAVVKAFVRGVVPTGKERKKEFLLDANPGLRQGKIGAGLTACLNLVNEEAYAANLHLGGDFLYVIRRNGELMVPNSTKVAGPAYLKLVRKGSNTAALAAEVAPAAQYLQNAKVDLGHYVELVGAARLSIEKGCVSGDVGYNLYWSGEQGLDPKLGLGSADADKLYYTVAQAGAITGGSAVTLAASTVELREADMVKKEGAQLRHILSANVDFLTTNLDWPIQVGLGAAYEFSQNSMVTPEKWSVGVRGGISF